MDTLEQSEKRLKRKADVYHRNEDKLKESYDSVLDEMHTGRRLGLTYDRIAEATGLSKTHIARILRSS